MFIGWSAEQRRAHIHLLAYNTRFLILPWVRVPHLASHLLARTARVISEDWQKLYHHPIYLLETFIDPDRFRGTCYRAANWILVGRTTGTRQERSDQPGQSFAEGTLGLSAGQIFSKGACAMAKRLPAGKDHAPEMTSLNAAQLEALLASLQPLLPGAVYEQVAGLLGTLQWVMELIQKKNTTIARLQRLIFGASTEKTGNVFPQTPVADHARAGAAQGSRSQWSRPVCGRPAGGGAASEPAGRGGLSGLPE